MAMIAKEAGVSPGCGRFQEGRIVEDSDPMLKGCEHLWRKASPDEVARDKATLETLLAKGLASMGSKRP